MHDGGGNRSSTVALTVKIIKEGKSDGYKFMTIPQLLAEQPGWHGPVISRGVPPTRVDTAGDWLEAYGWVFKGFYASLIRIMTVIIVVISALILLGAAADRIFSYRKAPAWHPDELGILIPCWKESKVIRNTVERVLHCGEGLPFPLRIVLVDDGSADNDPADTTWEILCELATEYPEVIAVQQGNGGKARALNFGLQYVTSDILIIMDADTIPKDAYSMACLVRWFKDRRVGAVAGNTRAGDRGTGWRQHMIANFQAAEYDLGIALTRAVQNLSNGIVIVPGAYSAFRTQWLREVGFLPDRVVAEDAQAPQRKRGAACRGCASCRTSTPSPTPRCRSPSRCCAGSGGGGRSACCRRCSSTARSSTGWTSTSCSRCSGGSPCTAAWCRSCSCRCPTSCSSTG